MSRKMPAAFVACLGMLSVSLVLKAQDPAATPQAPFPETAAAAAPQPYDDILKLWRANLSEDFVKRQIETGTTVYNLTAEDVIRCRDAGLPESLINVMLKTRNRKPEGDPAHVPVAAPAPGNVPLNSASEANRRWEGIARRNGGIVLFKGRWDIGTLEFKEESLRWIDARDAGKNLLIPARQIKEQFLTCLKQPGGNQCFEWGFRTKEGEYRFRDVSWQQSENKKPVEIFDFLKAIYPSLVSSNEPVDSK